MNYLTEIEAPGSVTAIPEGCAERPAIALHIQALKAQGHAIAVDEVYEPGKLLDRDTHGALRILHFKTCRVCMKGAA